MFDVFKYVPMLLKLASHKGEIERLQAIVQPLIVEAARVAPEAYSIVRTIAVDLFPSLEQKWSGTSVTATFDMRWLQTTLNELGATPPLTVTASYDDPTRLAVSTFQASHPEAGGVDGWAGTRTVLAMGAALRARPPAPAPT